MHLCLLLLVVASLASAATTTPSLDLEANTSLPLAYSDVAYWCEAPPQRGAYDRRIPSALDCLNALSFILVTVPSHSQPTTWSRDPHPGYVPLPYRRESGTCQLTVRLSNAARFLNMETASFDQVIGAALRIVEVCLLNGKSVAEETGGRALAGLHGHLDVLIWGTRESSGGGGIVLSNATNALNISGA